MQKRTLIDTAVRDVHRKIAALNLQPALVQLGIADDESLIVYALAYLEANLDHALEVQSDDVTEMIVNPSIFAEERLANQLLELLETIADIWARLQQDRPDDAMWLADSELDNQLRREALERLEVEDVET